MSEPKSTRGGKRAGAGRKPLPATERRVAITLKVPHYVAAKFREWCACRNASQSRTFSAMVNDWLK